MVNQTKTFSFKIIHQAKKKKKPVFPSDVERTVDAKSKS